MLPRFCPSCAARLNGVTPCAGCGWTGEVAPREEAERGWFAKLPMSVRLGLGWSVAGVLLYGLFVPLPFELALLPRLGVIAGYLAVAALFTPSVDMDDLGWGAGPFRFDNPFSWSDDWNRFMLQLAVLLAPGKALIYAARVTWALVAEGQRRR